MDLLVCGVPLRLVCSPGLDLLFSYTHLEEVLGTAVRPKPKSGQGVYLGPAPYI